MSKVILISGTSRGVGAALQASLRRAGHRVYGSSRKGSESDPLMLSLDVTEAGQCQRAVDVVLEREGKIDILINNAGNHLYGAGIETSECELREQMELNFFGAVNLTQAVLPSMLAQKSGKIINVSSVGGRFSVPFASAYNASKFALEGYMESLRLELLSSSIYVSILSPGFIKTSTTDVSIVPVKESHALYKEAREVSHEKAMKDAERGLSLEKVVGAVEKILASRQPALRYSMDGMAPRLLFLRAFLPSAFFERLVLKQTAPTLLPR